jgi:agmatine/peptidylarginine deiminase
MDVKTIQRYIDESQVKASNGEEITSSERARLLAASRRLNELNTAATAVDPYQAQIEAQTKAREEEAARLKAQSEALMTTEEKRLAAKYANLTSQAQQS